MKFSLFYCSRTIDIASSVGIFLERHTTYLFEKNCDRTDGGKTFRDGINTVHVYSRVVKNKTKIKVSFIARELNIRINIS